MSPATTRPRPTRMQAPAYLRCEHLVNPLGIDVPGPRLSWEVRDPRRGGRATAFQVLVASDPALLARGTGDLWDSGQVASGDLPAAVYAGRPLRSGEACYWKVRTWDAHGEPSRWSRPANWSMGLLSPDDWQVCWIADPQPPPPDSPAHNGYQCRPVASPDDARSVVVDLGASRRMNGVRLYGARPFDLIPPDAPGYLFPLRFRVEVATEARPDVFRAVVDRTREDVTNPGSQPWTLRFPQVSARFVRLVVTRLAQFGPATYAFALAELKVLRGEHNLALGAPVSGDDPVQDATWSLDRLTDGDVWPHPAGPAEPLPGVMMRKEFVVDGPVRRATVYATALGLYELRLNGERVGDHLLAPEWTDYDHWVQYQAYDVTGLLRDGPNALGALVGDGWYAGRVAMAQVFRGRLRAIYGRQPRFLMQLQIELADGRVQRVVTDGTWRSTPEGPVRSSDIYDGETVDLRKQMPGWDAPGFADRRWQPVDVVPGGGPRKVAQMREPIRVRRDLPPVAITTPEPGTVTVDFGQCFAGWVRLRCRGEAGAVVVVRHGQVLNADGTVHFASLRGALQTERYTLRGEPEGETLEPHFTYHGFRYAQITGLDSLPAPSDVTGVAFGTDLTPAGEFACSDPTLNALWTAADWTLRSNCMGVHTDCCDRDERLPWVIPDLNQAEFYLADLAAVASRFTAEMRLAQLESGGFPNMAPNALHMTEPVPGWGEASGIWMVWSHYLNYGDRRLLAEHYPSARLWAQYLDANCPDRISRAFTFGDWLNADTVLKDEWPASGGEVPMEVLGTACFAHSVEVVACMARALGENQDARRFGGLFREFRRAFTDAFLHADGRIAGDTQAGYALALGFDLLAGRQRAAALRHLLAAVGRSGGQLTTGNITSHLLLLALSGAGHHDIAARLALGPDCPSWGHMIGQGATAIWERWDSFVADRQGPVQRPRWQAPHPWETYIAEGPFQDPGMNSFNHPGYITVTQWMVECVLGLAPDPAGPGWSRFTVTPPGGPVRSARGGYRSPHGRIYVDWRTTAERLRLDLTVPPGATAHVALDAPSPDAVTESAQPIDRADGVELVSHARGRVTLRVAAGSYAFASAAKRE
jgi:alpha-L-rhamnosidase